jgi:hypothetical protein
MSNAYYEKIARINLSTGEIKARLIEERKVTGLDFSDALEAELTDLARQSGALGRDRALTDLLA